MSKSTKFEPGKSYMCRSVCDYDCTWTFTVASRTEKTIKMTDGKSFRVWAFNGVERVMPLGRYSMAPILTADKLIA